MKNSSAKFLFSLSIFTFICGGGAAAQDANIQSTFEDLRVQIPLEGPVPETRKEVVLEERIVPVRRDPQVLEQQLMSVQNLRGPSPLANYKSLRVDQQDALLRAAGIEPYTSIKKKVAIEKQVVVARKADGSVNTKITQTYESNATRRRINPIADRILGVSTAGVVRLPFKEYDTLIMNVGTTTARYNTLTAADGDQAFAGVAYVAYLHRYNKFYDLTAPTLATSTTLAPKFDVAAFYTPTFQETKFRLYSPALVLEHGNVPLSRETCGSNPAKPNYCHAIKIGASIQQNFSDSFTQRNTIGRVFGEYTWLITRAADWRLISSASFGVRSYYDLVTNRTDNIGDIAARLEWQSHANFIFSAGAKYTNQSSTLPAVAWHGYGLNPTISATIFF
jgi:hypothetical protein